jgi:hypothetical protein
VQIGRGGGEPERCVEFAGEAEIGGDIVEEIDETDFGNEREKRVYEQMVGEDCQVCGRFLGRVSSVKVRVGHL